MFTSMLHYVHTDVCTYVYTCVTPCSHLYYTMFTPMITPLSYVTPCSHLWLHLCYTMFTPMCTPMLHHVHTYTYTYVTPGSYLCYTMFTPMVTPMFTPMLYHV